MTALSRVEEIKLVARCVLLGDKRAFGALVDAYQGYVRSLMLTLTGGNEVLSEDLSQEVFVKAYLNISSFRQSSRFGTWIYRIACNIYLDYTRSASYRNTLLSTIELPEVIAYSDSPDERIDIEQCFSLLSERERLIVTLYYIEEMTAKEISKILEIPEGTVKSLVSRSRQKLKILLKDHK